MQNSTRCYFFLYINEEYYEKNSFAFTISSFPVQSCVLCNFSLGVVETFILMPTCTVGEPSCRRTVLSVNCPVGEQCCRLIQQSTKHMQKNSENIYNYFVILFLGLLEVCSAS